MSAPLTELPSSISSSGHVDGLGRRLLAIDRETGAMMERLRLRPELSAFENALRRRVDDLAHFEDERFARPFSVERDAESGELTVLSEFVAGSRMSDLLETAQEAGLVPGVDVALGFLLEALPALSTFHTTTGGAHGLVDPTRMVITPAGQIVFLDCSFAAVIERLGLSRSRLWTDLGFASPPASAGPVRHDVVADISQAALSAVMLVLGRRLREDEYPDALPALLIEVVDVAQIRGSHLFASGLQRLLQRSLPLPGRRPFGSAIEALEEVRQLLRREIGLTACHQALVDFTEQTDNAFSSTHGVADDEALAEEDQVEATYAARSNRGPMMIDVSGFDSIDSIEVLHDDDDGEEEATPEEDEDEPLEVELSLDEELAAPPPPPPPPLPPPPRPAPPQFVISTDLEPELEPTLLIDVPESIDAPMSFVEVALPPAAAHASALPVLERVTEPAAVEPAAADPEQAGAEDQSASSRRLKRHQYKSARARKDKLRSTTAPPPAPAPPPPPAVAETPARAEAAKPPASGWLVSPDRAAKFEPPVPEPPPPVVPALGHTIPPPPVYYPPPQAHPPVPPAVVPVVVQAPVKPIPMPVFGAPAPPPPAPAPPPPPAPPAPPAPVQVQAAPVQVPQRSAPLRMKSDAPAGYAPARTRDTMAPMDRGPSFETSEPRAFPWKLAAAAVLIVAVGIVVGRAYLPSKEAPPAETKRTVEAPAPEPAPAPTAAAHAAGKGDINIETQPAGAKVLLDGKPVGESPLKLTGIPAGRHILTFISTSGEVMKTVRVPSGKAVTVDVPIFSGWVAIFAPIVLEISENGKSIGTTEVDRHMLSPGQHELTLTNRDLGYKTVQEVTIDAGEVRSITIEPKGTVSINAVPWAEVWLDGQKLGDTPLANMRVPVGVREFVFKHPQHGEKKVTVTVRADETTPVSADFTR